MMPRPTRRLLTFSLPALWLAGCALAPLADPPRVDLVGIEGLPGEGLELRFMLRLRVQNLAGVDLAYDGISVELDLRGQRFASGVAPVRGSVPRFGEAVIAVPVSVPALSLARQLLDFGRDTGRGQAQRVPYALRGRLGAGPLGGVRFSREGEFDLGEVRR